MDEREGAGYDDAGTMHTRLSRRLSRIDGAAGELLIRGWPVEELASHVTYEEAVHLVWEGRLPSMSQLKALRRELAGRRGLSTATLDVLRQVVAQGAEPIDALRTGVSTLGLKRRPPSDDGTRDREDALTAVASLPTIIAAYTRLRDGREPIPPNPALGHAANFLYMLAGEADQAAGYLRAKLQGGERLVGFGYRDYRMRDPRAVVLEEAEKRLSAHQGDGRHGDGDVYALAKHVEGEALSLLAKYKLGRRLNTNLEFWVAVLLHGAGLPPTLFTPTFAAARTAGWAAHCFEQVGRGAPDPAKDGYGQDRDEHRAARV